MANPKTGCRCGSGGHPRRCDVHPGAYDEHVAELNAEVTDRVVFLDIDGVLNSDPYLAARRQREPELADVADTMHKRFPHRSQPQWSSDLSMIDPTLVARLNSIIVSTGAKVVLSSSWRRHLPREEMQALLETRGFVGEIIDYTPSRLGGRFGAGTQRGTEIMRWLIDSGKSVERFAILDDNGGMDGLEDEFVQTDPETGLTDADVERAIAILEGRAP